jgi:ABC-type uncharacterized transport system ATPase subunit
VIANKDISIAFQGGEVHCLLGENGAGKSTLMNIVFGLYQPDSGEIFLRGKKINIASSAIALRAGIGMVHQHFMLIDRLTVAENVVLGNEPPSRLSFRRDKANQEVREISKRYGLAVDPEAVIEDLSVGIRQRIEILKALYRKADILILDEPTAVLSPPEVSELYQIIESLKSAGKTIIFITHKLSETMTVSDRVTILRDGAVVGTVNRQDTSPEELARMMVGRDVLLQVNKTPCKPGKEVLTVKDLKVMDNRGLKAVQGVSLCVREGEIFGIAGIDGNGQTELIEALTGLRRIVSGEIIFDGVAISHLHPVTMLNKGFGHVPEDRNIRGLIGPFTVAENLILGYHGQTRYQKRGFLRGSEIENYADYLIRRFDIRTPNSTTSAESLSGGNQQKLIWHGCSVKSQKA